MTIAPTLVEQIEIRPGYLYFIQNLTVGGYKIGLTTNPPQRFKALKVGEQSRLLAYWQTPFYRELEKFLHSKYKSERVVQSEYFNLTNEQVQEVIDQVSACCEVVEVAPDLSVELNVVRLMFTHHKPQPIQTPVGFGIAAGIAAAALLSLQSLL